MIVVNCINIANVDMDKYQLFSKVVSEERRMKANRYHFINDSKRSICAELLLQYSLFQLLGRLVDMDIVYNEFGKPFVNNINGFSFNISHSGNWVAVAYGNTKVGIDIEKIHRDQNIADRFFSEDEKKYIKKSTKRQQPIRFTKIWTLKESYIKYLGTGFSTKLDSFSVNAMKGVVTNQDGVIQKGVKLNSYLFDKEYYLSVCSTEDIVTIQEIMIKDLINLSNIKIQQ